MKGATLIIVLVAALQCVYTLDAASAQTATCSLKDNCNIEENLLSVTGDGGDQGSSSQLENKIASLFEDKVNYSLKLFAEETILEYNTLDRNLSNMAANFTITQIELEHETETDDIEESEREYIYNIGQKLISIAKPFDASINPSASELCRLHTQQYLDGLQNFDLWALKMHDATGKLTSGILNGNINQPGDFDQCMGIKYQLKANSKKTGNIAGFSDADNDDGDAVEATNDGEHDEIKGQYCLAYAQPVLPHKSKRLQTFFKLLQSHGPFQSEFDDPGHRVPRYSLINWGICVPSSCSNKDVEYSVKEILKNMTASTGITFKVRVEPQMCQFRDNKPWDRNTTWAVRFFVTILSITILSTLYHHFTKNKQSNPWLCAFSLEKNLGWLFSTSSSADDIQAVHGLRLLNAIMLLFSHKSMAMFFNPYNNRTEMSESLGRSWTVIGRAASLYTDPFLLFSGMLTAYSFFGRLNKGQSIRLKNEYISRLIRIVPPLAALILFCTYILPMWGSGPQWNLVVGHHSDICKKNWWRNLLFIHNYFGFSEMCLTHTHHLGIDTELFAVAPIMILAMWKWPRKGMTTLVALCFIGTAARYYTTVVNELSNYIYFGTNIQRLFRTADYMYSFPPMRSTVYIMGIFLGYGLRQFRGVQLSRSQLRLGWFVAIVCLVASILGPAPMGDINYIYNSTHAAIYAAFAPIGWCIFFTWVVFVSHNGYKNRLTNFFSWRGFQVSTKLSYAIYLTQFPIFFYNVGRRRHIHHYYNFVSIILDTNEYICIFLASVALTVLFDAPFQNIKKILIKRPTPSTPAITKVSANGTTSSISSNSTIESCDDKTLKSPVKHLHSD
ncbi:nose resistant to fluoxetine protein 6 [Calliphora vicina]|uniref:nose resistant to fluoxetine protein 6 n=1 Tax=Calliphora vicina TaxID=7373 RepID=UPI00325AEFAA